MSKNYKLKVFVSYSHNNNLELDPYIKQFKKHLSPLIKNGLIKVWSDCEILPSEDFQNKIDSNLNDADIICLFVSADFLDSENCMNEKKKALELSRQKGVPVIPIILSDCGWLDDTDISKLKALPKDGFPVSKFSNRDEAWNNIYEGFKKIITKEIGIRQLELKADFTKFLKNTEMLKKAHSQKENVFLEDIFIDIELGKYDELMEYEESITSDDLTSNLFKFKKIIIAGENQSGKTTLCKKMFNKLRNYNFVPVYVSDKKANYVGKIDNHINQSLSEQYNDIVFEEIDKERIVPIIDDFHFARKKEKHIEDLSKYPYCIIIVDDIFGLNIADETLSNVFTTFRIQELKPSLRYSLIKKWYVLTDKNVECDYKDIDKITELIDTTLGKNIGKGIMPAYPFFILSTIITYETFSISLDEEITSQGYCYQAFIFFYLKKHGVKNDEIDMYINFLTELAFHIYTARKNELNTIEFKKFINLYSDTYNLPIPLDKLLSNLKEIAAKDCLGNFSFRYPYFYYFFVAKYISERMDDSKDNINNIINNLHVDENAYIAVFLIHHSKNATILSNIEDIAIKLFDKYEPATLTKNEMKFFDEQENVIVNMALPSGNTTPEKERVERLNHQDKMEKANEKKVQEERIQNEDSVEIELRRAIKTVEVIGCVIKNRAGSLKKVELKQLFQNAMNVHLRIISNIFELIKSESNQEKMVDFIEERLSKLEEELEPHKKLSKEKKREYAKIIFWNLNFFVVCGVIHKIIHSLGSDKLLVIVDSVCDEINSPSTFLVKHGILMSHGKNIQTDELYKGLHDKEFSNISKRAIKFMIADYCSLHPVDYRKRQRIQSKFGFTPKLLPDNLKDDK